MFDDIIANMVSNKKPDPIVTDLLIRVRKLNITLLSKYQTKESSNKLQLITHQILTSGLGMIRRQQPVSSLSLAQIKKKEA